MRFSCTRDNLFQGLSVVSHATGKNVHLPILQNVLLRAAGGTVNLIATNLEVATRCFVRGKVEEEGEFTVPAKLFLDYVTLLPNENISVSSDGTSLSVQCGRNKTRINGLPSTDFPVVPHVEGLQTFQIPVDGLRQALSRVLFAAATSEARPELAGISVFFKRTEKGTELILAATDSYRLAEASTSIVGQIDRETRAIIPAKTLAEVGRVLSVLRDSVESPSMIAMELSENYVAFTHGSVELISRTIEGTYPDYRQIIPQQFRTSSILDRDDFAKAVKTASLFSRSGLYEVSLAFHPSEKSMSVQSTDADRGENTAACSADVSGDENAVTLNYRYLLDGLAALGTERIRFSMIDASNPCTLRAEGEVDPYLYIIMPIKQ